ncbi:hypothetical protein J3Q64DRAFT_1671762 [Phycomyces blakesleeanus]|uniref:RBR-type E3 ubiquitin transferase n=2 Tax=Phycomyces blakesleeanus TaxID=4837 RepID=A0A167QNP9_PHYB8|nr:hypothetical protein PHYBLDRAFT_106941 [Phycomyces blakesleeanus NRRL 1555(-)]OAD79974.1 hypothetical protein PHYBLDRAFT_106941 [Phycomyces blakesleeanus NRRL 1555(-)]|eukprot:XP_018298014.1 hypothetical protein PHYBLDRAFT_106941 [Phycomyces blakesleeanus NRRL 1555(-)]
MDDSQGKKEFEVEYTVKDAASLVEMQAQSIDLVASVLGIQKRYATSLLWQFRWNTEILFEEYMESPEKALEKTGIKTMEEIKLLQKKRELGSQSEEFECKICFDDDPEMMTVGVGCGHRFCIDCYRKYITFEITEGNNRNITCPQEKCNAIADTETIEALMIKDVYEKHKLFLNQLFVQDQASMRWCPGIDCEYAVECNIPSTSLVSIIPIVKCFCGHEFCFGCGLSDHRPAICALVKKWMAQCAQDLETLSWIKNSTKQCPKCEALIEKWGGCNHMTCKKCRHGFCWVCKEPWRKHGLDAYTCHKYKAESVNSDDCSKYARRNVERYLHYYERYMNHQTSARLDNELFRRKPIDIKEIEEMEEDGTLPCFRVKTLKDAWEITVKSRNTLKWAYVLAFYMKETNALDLFEKNQRELEMAIESLSESLGSGNGLRYDVGYELILDKYTYAKQRLQNFLDYISTEIFEESIEFTVDLRQ